MNKISIPSVPLFFRSVEKAAWERNHPLGLAIYTISFDSFLTDRKLLKLIED